MDLREDKYKRMEELGRKLSIPVPSTHIGIKVEMDGQILEDRQERSHTWVRNAYNLLLCQMAYIGCTTSTVYQAGDINTKTTAGIVNDTAGGPIGFTTWSVACEAVGNVIRGAAGTVLYGIVVGTGVGAYSFENYALGTQIAHGNSATQLSYVEQQAVVKTYVAATKTWTSTFTRLFNNNSGNTIVVGETGLYIASRGGSVMVVRDVLSPTVSVAALATLTVSYTFSTTFPV